MSLYRNILAKAWRASWNNKYLWFFGLFAAFLGNSGEVEILYRGASGNVSSDLFPSLGLITETGFFSIQTVKNIGTLLFTSPMLVLTILTIFLILIILLLFIVWLSNISQIAVVNEAANSYLGQPVSGKKIQAGVSAGVNHFWPVFILNMLGKFIILLLLMALAIPVYVFSKGNFPGLAIVTYVAVYVIVIFLAMVMSLLLKYSVCFIVVKGRSLTKAVSDAWELLKRNWLVSVEMAIILFAITILTGLISLFVYYNLKGFFLFMAALFSGFPIIVFWLYLLTMVVSVAVIGSLVTVFQISCWTSLFVELVQKGVQPKILRIFNQGK